MNVSYIWTAEKDEFLIDHRSSTHNQAWTGIEEVMGSNPVQEVFFQALISQLLKLCV